MKKFKSVFICTSIFLNVMLCACKNNINSFNKDTEESSSIEKKTGIELKLPAGESQRAVYYSTKDITKYVITVKKDNEKIDEKNDTPGQSVSFEFTEEGTYSVLIEGFNADEVLIAEASATKALTFEKGVEKVEVNLNPKELKEYELITDEYNSGYYYINIPLTDLIENEDLIKGDVVDFSFYGYREDVFEKFNYFIMSGSEEDNYCLELSDKFNDYSANSNSAFILKKSMEIKNTSASEIDEYVLSFRSPFLSNETDTNHRESVKLLGNIKMELDKSNRIAPITVSLDPSDETLEITTELVYHGRRIKSKPVLENKFFEWADSNGNIVKVAPEKNTFLHAVWSDRLDLISRKLPFNWLASAGGKYQIKADVITEYPDADVVLEIEATENANWDEWNVILAIPHYGDAFPKTKTEGNTTFYRMPVSEIIRKYPGFQYLAVAGFNEEDGFKIKDLYLEYPQE